MWFLLHQAVVIFVGPLAIILLYSIHSGEDEEAPKFSDQLFLTLGGVDGDAGFLGQIAEVMIFEEALNDAEVRQVSQYLGEKYRIGLAPSSSRSSGSKASKSSSSSSSQKEAAASDKSSAGLSKEEAFLEKESEVIEKLELALGPKCQGGSPFQGVTVENYKTPDSATLVDIQKWHEAVAASKLRIKSFKGGGKVLRNYIHKEVKLLERLRHVLFCKYVIEEEGQAGGKHQDVVVDKKRLMKP